MKSKRSKQEGTFIRYYKPDFLTMIRFHSKILYEPSYHDYMKANTRFLSGDESSSHTIIPRKGG